MDTLIPEGSTCVFLASMAVRSLQRSHLQLKKHLQSNEWTPNTCSLGEKSLTDQLLLELGQVTLFFIFMRAHFINCLIWHHIKGNDHVVVNVTAQSLSRDGCERARLLFHFPVRVT